jgi:hypothetical protein
MSGDRAFVSEPQSDDRDVDPGLQHMHCDRMSNQMIKNTLLGQLGIPMSCEIDGELQSFGEADPRQRVTGPTWEKRRIGRARVLV